MTEVFMVVGLLLLAVAVGWLMGVVARWAGFRGRYAAAGIEELHYGDLLAIADALLADERLVVALTHNTREGWLTPWSDESGDEFVQFDEPGNGERVRVVPVDG